MCSEAHPLNFWYTLLYWLVHSSSSAGIRISHASGSRETSWSSSHSASVPHILTGVFVSEYVQSVDEVQHAVAVHSIISVYGTPVGGQLAGDVALVLQYIIHLEGQACVLEQGLGELGIPNQFISVHAAVCISSSALVADVGGKRHLPRHGYLYISPI